MGNTGSVVLLSGGMDSAICLAWALKRGPAIALSVDYGQRHRRELGSAQAVAKHFGVRLEQARVVLPHLGDALTSEREVRAAGGIDNLPTTFVPGRNALLLSLAGGLARANGFAEVVIGCSQVDFSGYPDCRERFVEAMEDALREALALPDFEVHAPLLHESKASSLRLALELNALDVLALTWTCYHDGRHPCGTCPSCVLRARGFAEAGLKDAAL